MVRRCDVGDLPHADGKLRVDRIFADDRRQHAARRVDEIADRQGGEADAAIDGRGDVGVAQVLLGDGQRRLILQNTGFRAVECGAGRIGVGLRSGLALEQLGGPIVLIFCVLGLRLRRRQVGLRLIDRRLILGFFDLIEQVADLHVLSFLEQDFLQEPLDAGAQLHRVGRLDAADKSLRRTDVSHLCCDVADGRRRRRWGGLLRRLAGGQAHANECSEQASQHRAHPVFVTSLPASAC